MISICNQHQTLVQLNKRGNYKMRWKIVDAKPQEKKFSVRAMISELLWRQIIAWIFRVYKSFWASIQNLKKLHKVIVSLSFHHPPLYQYLIVGESPMHSLFTSGKQRKKLFIYQNFWLHWCQVITQKSCFHWTRFSFPKPKRSFGNELVPSLNQCP